MKKRGFTLIELLAVIVVLAIIALIATPIVMNVIGNVQKGAAERSAERYVAAVETAIATDMLTNERIKDGIYKVDENGNLTSEGKVVLNVAVNGDIPKAESTVEIKNGQVVKEGTNLTLGDYTVTIDDQGKATAGEKESGTGNVVASTLCKAITLQSGDVGEQATSADKYKLGAAYSCDLGDGARTFYVLKVDGNNVKLIMNENIGEEVHWCASKKDEACEADGAKAYLVSQTSEWEELVNVGGTVELPDAQEIADVIGHENIAETYWEDNNVQLPTWLYVHLNSDIQGRLYWTSSSDKDFPECALFMLGSGKIYSTAEGWEGLDMITMGVRPVIVIPKGQLSL